MKDMSAAIDEMADGCIAFRARILGRAVSSIYDRALGHCGMSIAQVNILVFVGKVGEAAPAMIGEKMAMEKSTVSRNLRGLIDDGLLEAETSDAERVRGVRLSAKGRRRVEAVLPDWRKAQREARELLGEAGSVAIKKLGDTLLHSPAPG